MVPHLFNCLHVDPATKARAEAALAEYRQQTPRPRLSRSSSWSHDMRPAAFSSNDMPPPGFLPPAFSSNAWSAGPSIIPTPSPLPSPLLLTALEPPPKRKRTSSILEESPRSSIPIWTADKQTEFGQDFCKLLIANRAAWNFANNPQTHIFFNKWNPGSIVPDRRVLSGKILDREAEKVEDRLRLKLRGRLATFTTDGWKNKAKKSIVASMVSVGSEVSSASF
jgi:hypothetical protein